MAGGNAPAFRRAVPLRRAFIFSGPAAMAWGQRGRQCLADARPGYLRARFGEAAGIAARLEPGSDPDLQPRTLRGFGVGGLGSGHHRRSTPHGRQYGAGSALQAGRSSGGSLALPAAALGNAASGQNRPVHAADAVAGPGHIPRRGKRQPRACATLRDPHREARGDQCRGATAVPAPAHALARRRVAGAACGAAATI